MSTFEIVRGVEGDSLALDNIRICGPKPWGGGQVIKTFHTDEIYEIINKNEYHKMLSENAELRELVRDMWHEITTCPEYRMPPCMTDSICERVRIHLK